MNYTRGIFRIDDICFIDVDVKRCVIVFDAHRRDIQDFDLVPRLIGHRAHNINTIKQQYGAIDATVRIDSMEIRCKNMKTLLHVVYNLFKKNGIFYQLQYHWNIFKKKYKYNNIDLFSISGFSSNPLRIIQIYHSSLFLPFFFNDNPPLIKTFWKK